ncbi:MAG: serine/threonine protein kinase, partial [Candidatus Obscuribacterales bacterium]|nr:serine/threonine protein kinase [Candidatus Obscuribacterales bacterium]
WEPRLSGSNNELWLKSLSSAPKEAELMPLYPGDFVGTDRYQIISRIGVGGQGTAYLAKDCSQNQNIVLKETLFPVYVDAEVRAKAEARYKNEVAMLARLDNPHVVRMLDSFVDEHRGYLVLEYIDGLSLRQLVKKEGALADTKVIELAIEMANILKYIHELSPPLVHRDFTPENLLLEKDGRLVLIDFNVARQVESTKTATVVGKHAYIPPEQFRGDADARSDIYAFGATLFFLLCAEDPEPISQSFPAAQNLGINSQLNELVGRATALDMSERYASAEEVLLALNSIKEAGLIES